MFTNDGLIHEVQGYDAKRSELSLAHVTLQEGHLGVGVEEEVGEETSKSGLADVCLTQEQDGCSWCVYGGGGVEEGIQQFTATGLPQATPYVLAIATHLCAVRCPVPESTTSLAL